jgi:outer membrane protein assembly factor BamD
MKLKTLIITGLSVFMIFVTGSCEYHKLKKSKNPEVKTQAAHDYYDAGKFAKALPLYEDIILMKRNTQGYEKILYRYADSYYQVKDYILAGYYFRKFTEAFPKSEYAEDAQFMSAYCYYLDAPKTTLDQEATYTAINEFSLFLSKYSNSDKVGQCNELIDELREKLEKKAFDNASLYYDLGHYKAAVTALQNTLKDFPDTQYEEKTRFLIFKAAYTYADKSISSKQPERYRDAEKYYKQFISRFPNSESRKEADKLYSEINEILEKSKAI